MASNPDWALLKWLGKNATAHFSQIAEGFVGEVDQTVYATHMRDDEGEILVRGCHLNAFCPDLHPTPGKQRFLHEEFFLEQKGDAADVCLKRVNQERVVQLGIRNMESRPRLVAARVSGKVYLGNSVNFWLPREGVPAFLLTALLNSAFYDWRFRLTSSNNNINIYEVNTLPLPERLLHYFFERERLSRPKRNRIALQLDTLQHKVDALERAAHRGSVSYRMVEAMENAIFDLFELPDVHRKWILEERKG
ncbi:MAG: hypothetical protein ACYTGH_19960 [Planctomycetota bacterium]|jgi:hypothetical protein